MTSDLVSWLPPSHHIKTDPKERALNVVPQNLSYWDTELWVARGYGGTEVAEPEKGGMEQATFWSSLAACAQGPSLFWPML